MNKSTKAKIFWACILLMLALNFLWFKNTWLAGEIFGLRSDPVLAEENIENSLKAYYPLKTDLLDYSNRSLSNKFSIQNEATGQRSLITHISNDEIWRTLPDASDLSVIPQLVQNKYFGLTGLGSNKQINGTQLGSTGPIDISDSEWSNGITIAGVFIVEKPSKLKKDNIYYEIAGLHDSSGPILSIFINASSIQNYHVIAGASGFHSFPNDIDWSRPVSFILIIDNKVGTARLYINGKLILNQAANMRKITAPITLQVGKNHSETDTSYLRLIQELSVWGNPLSNDQANSLEKSLERSQLKAAGAIQKVNGLMLILITIVFLGCVVFSPFSIHES